MTVLERGDEKEGAQKYVTLKRGLRMTKYVAKSPLTKFWSKGRATTFSALLYFSCHEYGSCHSCFYPGDRPQLQHRGSQQILKCVPWSLNIVTLHHDDSDCNGSNHYPAQSSAFCWTQGVWIQVMSLSYGWRKHIFNILYSQGRSGSFYWLKHLSWR